MRQIPDLSYVGFVNRLRRLMGELPEYAMRWNMYQDYLRYHNVKYQVKKDRE